MAQATTVMIGLNYPSVTTNIDSRLNSSVTVTADNNIDSWTFTSYFLLCIYTTVAESNYQLGSVFVHLRDELQASIMSEGYIAEKIAGKDIVKVIVVPDKLVNIVVKG